MNKMPDGEAVKLAVMLHRDFNKHTDSIPLDFTLIDGVIWDATEDSVTWNIDVNEVDLCEGVGNTHSATVNYVIFEDDHYLLLSINDDCGNRDVKMLFDKKERYSSHE